MGLRLKKYIDLREMGGAINQRGRSLISTIALFVDDSTAAKTNSACDSVSLIISNEIIDYTFQLDYGNVYFQQHF